MKNEQQMTSVHYRGAERRQKQRFEIVDLMKGIAVLLVVLGHTSPYPTSSIDVNHELLGLVIYGFHMPAFFFIAGLFVRKWTTQPLFLGIKNKFFRLGVPYFIWGFIFAAYKEFGRHFLHYAPTSVGFRDFLCLPVAPYSVLWFLYVLFFFHVFYDIVIHATGDYERGRKVFLCVSTVAFLLHPFLPVVWESSNLTWYAVFFAIGTYSLEGLRRLTEHMTNGRCAAIVLAFCLINVAYADAAATGLPWLRHYVYFFTAVIGTLLVTVCAWALVTKPCLHTLRTFFRFCGERSMEIYVMHGYFIGASRMLMNKYADLAPWTEFWLIFFITVAATCLVWKAIRPENRLYRILFGTGLLPRT